MTTCEYCSTEFDELDDGYIIDSIEGKEYLVCGSCWDDEHFMCAVCYGDELKTQQGAIGNLLVVVDAEKADTAEGLYEIISHPYWCSDYISASLFSSSLRYIGPIPDVSIDTEDCPVGHLCTECSTKYKGEVKPYDEAV